MNRAAAARSNGARSNGPVTETGKALSSRNAIRHGLTASQVVIPGENAAEYEALVAAFSDDYQPATLREDDLLSEMTAARWRLRRLPVMEQATFTVEFDRVRKEAVAEHLTSEQEHARAWIAVTLSPAMKQIHRHETRLRRAYEKARVELETLIDRRILEDIEAVRRTNAPASIAASAPDPENTLGSQPPATQFQPQIAVQNEPAAMPLPAEYPHALAA